MNNLFLPYKDKHLGQTCIIYGTGPTLKKFEGVDESVIHIGVNEIVKYRQVMDYYFIGDPGNKSRGFLSEPEVYNEYKPNLAKFCRHPRHVGWWIGKMPLGMKYTQYYLTNAIAFKRPDIKTSDFSKDIVVQLTDGASIVFEAFQFALYSGFKKVFLVGMDCDYTKGTFNCGNKDNIGAENLMLEMWKKFKKFADREYNDVNIITINPKGMRYFDGN